MKSKAPDNELSKKHLQLLLRVFFESGDFKAGVTTDSALLLDLQDAGLVVTVGPRKEPLRWLKLSTNLDVLLPRSSKSSRRTKYDVTEEGAVVACGFIASLRSGFVFRVSRLTEFRSRRGSAK